MSQSILADQTIPHRGSDVPDSPKYTYNTGRAFRVPKLSQHMPAFECLWTDPEGVRLNPNPPLRFELAYENEIIWSHLFHFHGIFKKNEIKAAK